MESKEFVSKIKDTIIAINSDTAKLFEQLEKDLDVLETLKKYIRVNNLAKDEIHDLDFHLYFDLMIKEDAEKIKDWLIK